MGARKPPVIFTLAAVKVNSTIYTGSCHFMASMNAGLCDKVFLPGEPEPIIIYGFLAANGDFYDYPSAMEAAGDPEFTSDKITL